MPAPMTCWVPPEDLIAYEDSDLPAEQAAALRAHLRVCPLCRERLECSRAIGRLVRRHVSPTRYPASWAPIMRRVEQARRQARRRRLRRFGFLSAPLAVALLVAALLWPSVPSQATFPLDAFVRDVTPSPARVGLPPGQEPPGERRQDAGPSDPSVRQLAFPAVAPESLPPDLTLVDVATPSEQVLTLFYRNDRMDILVAQTPVGQANSYIPREQAVLVHVDGVDVLWQGDQDAGTVSSLLWVHRGVQFDLLVTLSPYGGLPLEDALAMVSVFIAAREAGE